MENEDDQWLNIVNLDKLINFSRKVVYANLGEEYSDVSDVGFLDLVENMPEEQQEEMNSILSMSEAKAIFKPFVRQQRHKKTLSIKTSILEADYDIILRQLSERMISNIVRNLVNRGLVESAFDEEKNDFVFWVKKDY
tara:strand:- start:3707 stop:4120 length:414 start_codon:yes stop_codon:yes gene_type:complete